jgi:hypothetical protein
VPPALGPRNKSPAASLRRTKHGYDQPAGVFNHHDTVLHVEMYMKLAASSTSSDDLPAHRDCNWSQDRANGSLGGLWRRKRACWKCRTLMCSVCRYTKHVPPTLGNRDAGRAQHRKFALPSWPRAAPNNL